MRAKRKGILHKTLLFWKEDEENSPSSSSFTGTVALRYFLSASLQLRYLFSFTLRYSLKNLFLDISFIRSAELTTPKTPWIAFGTKEATPPARLPTRITSSWLPHERREQCKHNDRLTNNRKPFKLKSLSNMLEIKFKQLHSYRNRSKRTEKFINPRFVLI